MSDATRYVGAQFWHTANARDWVAFAALLHPQMLYLVPQTGESSNGREAFVDVFRTWPGDWTVRVLDLVADEAQAVARIDFVDGDEVQTGIGFFDFHEGLIHRIVDYWPSPYEPPPRASALLQRRRADGALA